MNNASSLVLLSLLAACAPADKVDALEQRVATLEEELKTLKAAPARPGAAAAATTGDPAAEAAADAILKDIVSLSREGKYDEAKAKLAILKTEHGTTQTYKKARRLEQELEIIGKAAPASWAIEKWYQGESRVKLDSGTTLLVFWEEWCPHCKREVPEIAKTYETLGPQGLQVVGLTKITKSSTEEKVESFLKKNNVTYPMAKETGALSEHFGVSGVPAAAVVKDGKVVWRGHPASLTEDQLKSWL